jgi:hypothetical protein
MVFVRRSWPAWPGALKTLPGLVLRQYPAHLHALQVSAFVQLVCLEEWNQRFPQFADAFVDVRFYSRRDLQRPRSEFGAYLQRPVSDVTVWLMLKHDIHPVIVSVAGGRKLAAGAKQ